MERAMSDDFLKSAGSLFDVRGKTAIITGASGAFGALAAKVLAGAGANVVLAAGNADELKQRFALRPLIMTEKDAVKCRDFALENWWYLPVTAQLPDKFATRLLAQLKELRHGTGL